MRIGIVGNGTDKFTPKGKAEAVAIITDYLDPHHTLLSGHSPVGGIDIWAEEVAERMGASMDIKTPEVHQWDPPGSYGYKARNLDIAHGSELVLVILADVYPEEYTGRRFNLCYHCKQDDHVKSGGCWTGKQALKAGIETRWYVVNNY
jgi:hypothetical protein